MKLSFLAGAASAAIVLLIRDRQRVQRRERLAAASLETLLNAIEANDHTTGEHVRRVAAYSLILARAIGLDEHGQRSVERIALFHDIGKIHEALSDLVDDPSSLSPDEYRLIATHTQRGAEVLRPISRFYPDLCEGVLSHHEKWDGSGYPRGLRGTQIPLQARVIAIADAFDVITHDRPYKRGQSAEAAAAKIAAGRGTHFDPALVDRFLSDEIRGQIQREVVAWRNRGPRTTERRHRKREEVPDITFRWRSEAPGPQAPGRSPRRSPG